MVSDSLPLNGGKSATGFAPSSLTEQFYEHLPFYLAIGMTCKQYWEGDCRLTRYYRKAHQMKQRMRNQELWLQGAYFYEALVDAAPLFHAFAKKGTKPIPYITEPFALTNKELKECSERENRRRYAKCKAKLMDWAAEINAQKAGKEAKQDG